MKQTIKNFIITITVTWWDDVYVALPWLICDVCTVLSRLFLRLVSGISRQITMSRLLLLRRPLISGQGPDNALFWWLSWPSPGELHKRGYKGKLELPNWILRIIQRTFLAIDMGLNVHRRLQLRTKRIFHKIYVYRGRVWILFLRALNMEY